MANAVLSATAQTTLQKIAGSIQQETTNKHTIHVAEVGIIIPSHLVHFHALEGLVEEV